MKLPLLVAMAGVAFWAWAALADQNSQPPQLKPKDYRIGITPSHLMAEVDPLFEPDAQWQEVWERIDFYKYYANQLRPPKWLTKLTAGPFAAFMKQHDIAIASEFGGFGPGTGKAIPDAADSAVAMLKPIFDAGGKVDAIHLDGPVRRMLKGFQKSPNALTLDQIAALLAEFWTKVHKAYPDVEIGLITNFPNWDYTKDLPGYNGHYTDASGVTYHEALTRVYEAVTKAGDRIAFVEVDCPYGYYKRTTTRNADAPVDNQSKFLALQKWCEDRKIKFHIIVNNEIPQPPEGRELTAAEQTGADKAFHDGTLEYIRRLREDGIFPDVFLIQSWYVAPAKHLPVAEKYTFMNTARQAVALIEKLYPREHPRARPPRKGSNAR